MENLIPLILLFPLLGVVINGLWGYRLGRRAVSLIGPGVVGLSFLVSIVVVYSLSTMAGEHPRLSITLFEWIRAGDFHIPMEFMVDHLTGLMLLVITGIGFLIHIYSTGYMSDDPGYARFFTYLNLFVFSMLILVLGANYLLLFAGWELVGLCSFLLISFWFTNTEYASAGRKAFVVNRIGDFGFALGIMLIFTTFGTLNHVEVFEQVEALAVGTPVLTVITLLLFVGAVGKSAQLPLYVWLPDAMAGPTPVSALIHAATMVTAGVYMIARNHALYDRAPFSQEVVAIIGAATALFAGLIAITQTDIKKVLAYSTVSQLGYMVLGVGTGAYVAGVFHLYTHAFFKALLFLGAGSVMHALGGEQDMRKMGGLLKYIPRTGYTFIIGGLALAGIFPFAGFWSKDEILAAAFNHGGLYQGLWLIGILTAGITAFYTMRQVGMVFFGDERWRTALAGGSAGHGTTSPAAPVAPSQPPAPSHEERRGEVSSPAEGTGEKPRRPRPGQVTPASAAPEPPAAEIAGDKPKRPRPGQTVAASTPETPSRGEVSSPVPSAADKPKRPRPGQATAPASHAATSHTTTSHAMAADHEDGGGHGHGGHGFSGEPHESPPSMTVPLMVLTIGAVAAGWANIPGVNPMLEHWLEPVFGQHEMKVLLDPVTLALISLAAAAIGAVLAMMMYGVPLFGIRLPRLTPPNLGGLYTASLNKFYVDELYDTVFVRPFKTLADWFWQVGDKGLIDGIVNGVAHAFSALSGTLRRAQTGYMRNYAVWMLVGVVVLIFWFFYQ